MSAKWSRNIALIALLFAISANAFGAQVKIGFEIPKGFPGIELREVAPAYNNQVSRTGILPPNAKSLPFGAKLKDRFSLKAGAYKTFVLLLKNHDDRDRFFFAVPHVVKPGEAALGHHFECLCNRSVFRLPKGESWFRVVRVELAKDFSSKQLELLHTIVEVSEIDAKTQYARMLYNYDN